MKRALVMGVVFLLVSVPVAMAQEEETEPTCTTIQDGTLVGSDNVLLETGYDVWGYNYQAHMFNGMYCDAYRDAEWCQAWAEDELMMKWNDAWLSNQDCDGDGKLDRHHGFDTYIGSGAWLTNHMSGTYADPGGGKKPCRWNYFVKIIAAPGDAYEEDGIWYDATGEEIGDVIWGSFAIVQVVEKDPCKDMHGMQYKGLRPGLGNWDTPPDEIDVEDQ